ncbi:hypothetical protein BASA81_007729 [Batrachochytrium salamandrivorans]|nr:hypothetical protein BASA81_007729 [Batrachochytrium salamandrivorans]
MSRKINRSSNEEEDMDSDIGNTNLVRFESGAVALRHSPSSSKLWDKQRYQSLSLAEYSARSAVADVCAAVVSSFFVAIPVCTIDRAIVQSVAGTKPLGEGLKSGFKQIFTQPIQNLAQRSFFMVFGVYAGTYFTANSFESQIQRQEALAAEEEGTASSSNLAWAKFLAVTAVNMSLAVSKDRAFAQMYGTISPSTLPLISWGCWITRDLLTIGAAFSIPKPLAEYLTQGSNPIVSNKHYAGLASQLFPVMLVQLASTPLHLAANDYYNFQSNQPRVVNPATGVVVSGKKTPQERLGLLVREGPKSFVARLGRIAPAFGFGGIYNAKIRNFARAELGL